MQKAVKYTGYAIIVLAFALIIGNPSYNDFKQYIGERGHTEYLIYKKVNNYLLFSTYEFAINTSFIKDGYEKEYLEFIEGLSGKYVGFFLNFYKVE